MGDAPERPRLLPLPPGAWSPEMRDALAALRPAHPRHPFPRQEGRPKGLNALGLLALHPELTRAFNTFNGHILFGSYLTPRQREIVVLRVAAVRRAEYEWRQHVVLAGDAGIEPAEIAWIVEGPAAPGWSPVERAIVAAVDELIADATLSDPTWTALTAELGEREVMDLVFTVGCYDMLAMVFRAFGVPVDDDLERTEFPFTTD